MTVEGPNGIRIAFPDGTPPEVIDRVMREAISGAPAAPPPQPPSSYEQNVAGQAEADRMNRVTQSTAIQAVQQAVPQGQRSVIGSAAPAWAGQPAPQPAPPQMAAAPTMPPGPPLNPAYVPPRLVAPTPQPPQAPPTQSPPAPMAWPAGLPAPGMDMNAGLVDPNQSLAGRNLTGFGEGGFAQTGPIEPMGAPPIPGLEQPSAQGLSQALLWGIPGGSWVRGASLLPKITRAGVDVGNIFRTGSVGAGIGATSEAIGGGNPEDIQRGAAFGAVAGAGVPAAAAGVARALSSGANAIRSIFRPSMTAEELATASKAAYDFVESSGVAIQAAPFQNVAQNLEQKLMLEGFDAGLNPMAARALARLQEASDTGTIGLSELEILRRVALNASSGGSPADRKMSRIIINEITDFMDRLTPADTLGGVNPTAATEALTTARDLWSRARKSIAIETLVERARDRVGANYTQAGMLTALRQQFASLTNSKAFRTFTPEEQALVRQIIRGGGIENALKFLSFFNIRNPFIQLGAITSGAGAGAGVAAGAFGAGAALPLAAAGLGGLIAAEAARKGAALLGGRRVSRLDEFIREGGAQPNVLPSWLLDSLTAGGTAGGRVAATEADQIVPSLVPFPPPWRQDFRGLLPVRTTPVTP